MWRTEVRIGAQVTIDPRLPLQRIEDVHKQTKGLIMRHIYGPIYDELVHVIHDLYDAGLYKGDPAVQRVDKMLNHFHAAFQGEC